MSGLSSHLKVPSVWVEKGAIDQRSVTGRIILEASFAHNSSLFRYLQLVKKTFACRRVLYPGSYLDITPSLVFPEVCYVDSLKGIARRLADPELLHYIRTHKGYPEDSVIRCNEADYVTFRGEPAASFDLLISLNAGFISQHCRHFLRPGGLLLVNNGHYDANRTYVDPDYEFVTALEGDALSWESLPGDAFPYFSTPAGEELTLAMVERDAKRPPSKARFRPSRQAEAYLFRRVGGIHSASGVGQAAES